MSFFFAEASFSLEWSPYRRPSRQSPKLSLSPPDKYTAEKMIQQLNVKITKMTIYYQEFGGEAAWSSGRSGKAWLSNPSIALKANRTLYWVTLMFSLRKGEFHVTVLFLLWVRALLQGLEIQEGQWLPEIQSSHDMQIMLQQRLIWRITVFCWLMFSTRCAKTIRFKSYLAART